MNAARHLYLSVMKLEFVVTGSISVSSTYIHVRILHVPETNKYVFTSLPIRERCPILLVVQVPGYLAKYVESPMHFSRMGLSDYLYTHKWEKDGKVPAIKAIYQQQSIVNVAFEK